MNVLHVINNLNREGAQVMLSNLLGAADGDEVSYSVCLRQPGGSLVSELRGKGLEVFEPEKYYGFRSLRQSIAFIKSACLKNRVRIIHAHMADAAFLGWLVARELNLPLVVTHHGQDILLKCNPVCRSVYYVLLTFAARYAAMNIAVSESVADRVRQLLRVDPKRLQVIGNGVRIPEESTLRMRLDGVVERSSSLTLVSVGRLVPLKGQRELILAMVQLVKVFPAVRLYLVGGGELEKELKQLVENEKLADCVEFTGAVDDVTAYLAKADIFLSSSQSEGMPVSVLEAMAWRLPVIASDIPGHRSVVSPGETGFLYEAGCIDKLVIRIVEVAENRELASAVAGRARSMVSQQYSSRLVEQRHARLYQSLLEQV